MFSIAPYVINPVNDSGWDRKQRPVINVSWQDAQCYALWLKHKTGINYHLPSEAQWEYAARSGSATKYYWNDLEKAEDFAWWDYESNGYDVEIKGESHTVGGKTE